MIIVRLRGGLGNQMFQYATGRCLAEKNKTKLILDTTFLLNRISKENITFRKFELNNLKINYRLSFFSRLATRTRMYNLFFFINKLYYFIKNLFLPIIVEKKEFIFEDSILKLKDGACIDGYWQNEKYFIDIKDILQHEFIPKYKLSIEEDNILQQIINSNSVSVHVRRGDYLKLASSRLCGLSYYKEAMNKMRLSLANPTFFLFSDDVEWLNDNFKECDIVIVSHNDLSPCTDFFLMSQCKHNIISDSSFSWWASWINNFDKKIIIHPKKSNFFIN